MGNDKDKDKDAYYDEHEKRKSKTKINEDIATKINVNHEGYLPITQSPKRPTPSS